MSTSSANPYVTEIHDPVMNSFPSAGTTDVNVGAAASKTLALLGVPLGQTVSKNVPAVCAEYQFATERPSHGVSFLSMDATKASDHAGKGLALALS